MKWDPYTTTTIQYGIYIFLNSRHTSPLRLLSSFKHDNPSASTTRPDIRYEFEPLHASPFRLLAILKPTTPFISIPLCTTSSTSHLLAFLESTVPSFPPLSWTLFVIFFLSSVGTVAHDADFHLTLLRLKSSYGTCTVNILRLRRLKILRSKRLKLISNSTYTASGTVQVIVTTILRSK